MANVNCRLTINVHTTPQELRKLADDLEREFANTQLGHMVPSRCWLSDDAKYGVMFFVDQSKMHAK